MIDANELLEDLIDREIKFFTGVPDSYISSFCSSLMKKFDTGRHHIIAPSEGAAVALAAGHYLANKTIPLVYMQNSGIGNAINPIVSLIDSQVYNIPLMFVIGWRGKPGQHDEPQHIKQGAITIDLLQVLRIPYVIFEKSITMVEAKCHLDKLHEMLKTGTSVAIIIEKEVFSPMPYVAKNIGTLSREEAIQIILEQLSSDDIVISTTGKTSREIYEYREQMGVGHSSDFLTVGSMGHASMIALEIAESKPKKQIWCLDGDGAAIMHLGALALIGARKPANLRHILFNNAAHESVGGFPTIAQNLDFVGFTRAAGYQYSFCARNEDEILCGIRLMKSMQKTSFFELIINNGSRENLGRPKGSPEENKLEFMKNLEE